MKLCDFGVCLKMKDDLSDLANADDCYVGTAAWSGREVLEGGESPCSMELFPLRG